jgi:hypothetical protein
MGIHVECAIGQLQLGRDRTRAPQLADDADAIGRRQALVGVLAALRRVQADPDQTRVRVGLPEAQELFEVAVPSESMDELRGPDALRVWPFGPGPVSNVTACPARNVSNRGSTHADW